MKTQLRQRGMALMVMLTVAVLGVAWFAVVALGKASSAPAGREQRTAAALQAAKEALLAYVALRAANPNEDHPGRLPCPENRAQPGTADEGIAAPFPGFASCPVVGRLPWKTLGIDQLRDADGEPLWLAVATGTWALTSSSTNLTINPGLGNQLDYDTSPLPAPNAVALIIAPGRPLNTLAAGTPPSGCTAVDQQANRYAVPYDPAKFLECGNEASPGNYRKAGPAGWSNDRSISISAAEVMDAIMGAVAQRVQREVAPAMNDWYNTQSLSSWGERFLPHASTFNSLSNNPSVNDLCGVHDVREGMPPTAPVASCNTNWSSGSASGLGSILSFGGCTPGASEMRCQFATVLGGLISPTITATAPRIGNSFRSFNPADVKVEINGGAPQGANVINYGANVSSSTSNATVSVEIQLPLLSVADNVVVRIPNPAEVLDADTRTRWFVRNGWDRFTYYAVPRAVTVNSGGDDCRSSDTSECIRVNGMPDPTNRKRLVLALMGQRPLAGQSWPGSSPAAYLEAGNATTGDRQFDANRIGPSFNDRLAACPHTIVTASGSQAICGW
jgi:hypothetical protein